MERLIKEFWNDVVSQDKDKDKLKKYFSEDAIIRWHCTNESFNVDEYIIANCEYPGRWSGEIEGFIQVGNIIITVTKVFSEDISFHATSFFTIKNNKIKELDEYYGDDGFAPKWRLDKQIGKQIK